MLKPSLTGLALAAAIGTFGPTALGVEARAAAAGPAAQSSSQGGVTITVKPQGLSREAKTWDFAITLETHTQPLDDDLAKSSTLVGGGKAYSPIAWEGAPPGGHHRKGLLRFRAMEPPPETVELQIRRKGEASPRNFRWQVN